MFGSLIVDSRIDWPAITVAGVLPGGGLRKNALEGLFELVFYEAFAVTPISDADH